MSKRKRIHGPVTPPTAAFADPPPQDPLNHQNRWSGDPWKCGELPAQAFMGVSRPHDQKATPYGHGVLAVEPPKNRGDGWPKKGD